jgi:ribosomal protein S24E
MSTKIISETKQELMKRTEVTLELTHAKKPTPKGEEVLKEVATVTKKDEKLISIIKITNKFGSNIAKITANIYDNVEDKTKAERINKKKLLEEERKAVYESKKAEKEAKEKPAEETPKEETSNVEDKSEEAKK